MVVDGEGAGELAADGDELAVGQHDSLGQASRPTRVGQQGDRVAVDLEARGIGATVQQFGKRGGAGRGLAEHDHPADPERTGTLGEVRDGYQHLGIGIVELALDFLVARRRIEPGHRRAEPHRRQRAGGDRRHVRCPRGDALAGPEAIGVEPCRDAFNASGQLAIAHCLAAGTVDEG